MARDRLGWVGVAIVVCAALAVFPEQAALPPIASDAVVVATVEQRMTGVPAPELALLDRSAMHVVREASRLADRPQIPALENTLARTSDPLVVAHAIQALARLGEFGDRDSHLELLDDPRLRVRQEAVRALGASADRRHALRLIEALARDRELEFLLVQALGRLGGGQARKVLEERLRATTDPVTAAFLREALRSSR